MSEAQEADNVIEFVKQRADEGWSPVDAINWAVDRDYVVSEFEAVVALTRLCLDDPERKEPAHILGHRVTLTKGCVGEGFIEQMRVKFGLSEERAQYIIDHQDAAMRTYEGLGAGGGE